MPSRATIQLRPGHGVVDIDGQDISHVTRSITVHQDADGERMPLVVMELVITDLTKVEANGATVEVGPDTRAALLALGWTPPVEAQEDAPQPAKETRRGR